MYPTTFCGRTTFGELAALLKRARFLVSNDSGPIHVAASQRTRILGLYGPTSPKLTAPLSEAALVFEAAAADGYSGHIGLILAVRESGELVAVRVTQHKETPGLGDYVEAGVLFFTDELGTLGAQNPEQLKAAARGMRRGLESFLN